MEDLKKRKTPFDNQELAYFKSLLLEKRNEAEKELEAIDRNIENLIEADDADYSSVDHHMGDVGSDVEEQDLNYQLKERTQKFIEEIDDALERIENGTYGICKATGKIISKGRLESVPHTRYSKEAKEKGLAETQ
ncbi:MAG: molecular chaperone DnaK [Balneolaceae bacterium]|nr:molecular chaperone DnaK [Balneolaceae bacterium]